MAQTGKLWFQEVNSLVCWALVFQSYKRKRHIWFFSVSDIGHPYSLDVFEGHLYWTTKDTGEVWRTNKFGNGNKVKVLTINPWLTQVRVYQEHRYNQTGQRTQVLLEITTYFSMSKPTSGLFSAEQNLILLLTFLPVPNPCKNICSHLCLLRPGGYTCACPQGSSLSEFDSGTCDAGKDCVCLSAAHLRSWTSPSPVLYRCLAVVLIVADVVVVHAYAWLLLLQPLSHLFQCLLHVDAWMAEPATPMKVACRNASKLNWICYLYQ